MSYILSKNKNVSTGTQANPDLHSVTRVYRRTNERYADCCVLTRDRFGGGTLMVWDGRMGDQKTNLVVMQGNLNARRFATSCYVISPIPGSRCYFPT